MGDHLVRCGKCYLDSDNGLAGKRLVKCGYFLIATLLFVLASWLCGIANSLEMLIVFRVLQGAVAGPIIPLSQSLLLNNYPPEKRGMALAFWSMTIVVAQFVARF